MSPALASVAPERDAPNFLEDNLDSLGLQVGTRKAIEAATPRGRVVLTGDRTPLIEIDGHLLGAPLPEEELRRTVTRSRGKVVFLVFGLGMGHMARAIREYSSNPIVVFEPDPGVLRTVLEHGPTDLGSVHVLTSLHDLMPLWIQLGIEHLEAVVVRTPGYAEAYPESLLALPTAVHDVFQRIGISQNTYQARARTWIEDILENLESIIGTVPFLSLSNQFKNVPAFIVGAGPSLDKNVDLLPEAAKKGIVFCVNSSSRALAKHGVEPHVLACIESIDSSSLLAELPFIDRVIRAFSMVAAPNILRTGKGPLLPLHEALPQFHEPLGSLLKVPGASVCGSVSTAAFSMAYSLGCSPIVFVGQDLAYTSGRTHAGGTWWEDSRATVSEQTGQMQLEWSDALKKIGHRHGSEPLSEIPAWGGQGTVFSGASFTGIRSWLESVAAMLKGQDCQQRLVNATEGGGHLEGYEELRLREVLDELPELGLTVESIVAKANETRSPITREHASAWARSQAERSSDIRTAARRLRRTGLVASEAIRLQDSAKVFRAFAALDRAEEDVRNAVHGAPLVDLWAHSAVTETADDPIADAVRDARADAQRATERGIRVATTVERSAAELRQKFLDIANRLDEGAPHAR